MVMVRPALSVNVRMSWPYWPDGQNGVAEAERTMVVIPAAWLTLIGCVIPLKLSETEAPLTVVLASCNWMIRSLVAPVNGLTLRPGVNVIAGPGPYTLPGIGSNPITYGVSFVLV